MKHLQALLCAARIAVIPLLASNPAVAKDLFTASISVGGGPPATIGTDKATEIPDFFDLSTLQGIEPGYDLTQAVSANVDVRGLNGSVNFNAFSNTLRFQVPDAGIDVSFSGATRDEAQENFEDWLVGDFDGPLAPGEATTRLLQALVAHSPVDPMAGNPNSLQSRMFAADWRVGTGGGLGAYANGGVLPSLFKLNAGAGVFDADGYTVHSIDVPLTFGMGLGESVALRLDIPTSFTSTQGAWTAMSSGGLSLAVKPFSWWTVTPAARFGGVGSFDVGALGMMYSGSITSQIRIPIGPFAIGVGNMGGYARTVDGVEVSDYELEYDIENWVTRNGVFVEGSFGSESIGTGLGWRIFGSDVRFFGDDLYMDNYQEVGAGIAAGLPIGGLGIELTYVRGRNYDGVSARLAFRL